MGSREFIPEYTDDILAHAVSRNYPQIMNESALALAQSCSTSRLIANLYKRSPTFRKVAERNCMIQVVPGNCNFHWDTW